MRAHGIAFVILLLTSRGNVQASPSQDSHAAVMLDGWRGYKFGMTMEQARRVPGATLPGKPMGSTMGLGDSLSFITKEDGQNARVTLRFMPVSGLRMIILQLNADTPRALMAASDCEERYGDLLKRLEARYGNFAPRSSKMKVGTLSMHSVPGGKSRYSETVSTIHPGWTLRMGDAAHYFGPRFVTAQMQDATYGSPQSSCELSVGIVDPT